MYRFFSLIFEPICPAGLFDNIVWDTAIEHCTPEEITGILHNIKEWLVSGSGVLRGYTLAKQMSGKALGQHEYEIEGVEATLSNTAFRKCNRMIHLERHNPYFWVPDGTFPF